MKKKYLTWLCACMLLLVSALPTYAADLSVTTEETIVQGVTYRHIQKLLENGWQDIYVVQADLNHPHLKFDVFSHAKGKSYLQNTYDSAVQENALAAVNADFFSPKSGQPRRGSAIGLEIADGVLRTSPAAYEKMNVLYQPKDENTLYFNPFTYSFTVTAPDGTSAPIAVINKYDSMTGLVMYTRPWGETTPGSEGNVLELVVENGVVTQKNRDVGPVAIPEEGYVLACDLSMNTFLDDHLSVGSQVTIDISTAPNFQNIETAVGGGGMVLIEGAIPKSYSHNVYGTHPRSAVGVDQTGKIITLVAVDGRRSGAAGMTMTQLGYLMAELGCYNAMNLDGGGSTLMSVQQQDGSQKVVNTPSDGSKRAVTNSVGIRTKDLGDPVLSAIQLKGDDSAVFSDTSVWLHLNMIDQYGRSMGEVSPEDITWEVAEGSGRIENNTFYPTAPGRAVIRAAAAEFTDEITLSVLDTPYRLDFHLTDVPLNPGENCTLLLKGTDAQGESATIYPKDVQIAVEDTAVATMESNSVHALAAGSTVIAASVGDVTAHTVVTVGGAEAVKLPKNTVKQDVQQTARDLENENSFRFTVFGNTRTPAKLFDLYIMNGVTSAVGRESGINLFVGNSVNDGLLAALGDCKVTADNYFRFTYNGSTFITMKNASGATLYGSDKTQLTKLKNEVEALSGGNLFVFLNDHNISSNPTEVTLFKQLMEQAAHKGCTVYVFGGGFVNETTVEHGVRYITTAGVFPSIGLKPPASNISYVKYYLVTVNGNQVTYETKGIV